MIRLLPLNGANFAAVRFSPAMSISRVACNYLRYGYLCTLAAVRNKNQHVEFEQTQTHKTYRAIGIPGTPLVDLNITFNICLHK
jgi:hypothetical protein